MLFAIFFTDIYHIYDRLLGHTELFILWICQLEKNMSQPLIIVKKHSERTAISHITV